MTLPRALAVLALLSIAAAAAALWMLGSALSAPAQRTVGEPPGWLAAEQVSFDSASGSRIRAWLAPGRSGAGGVVLAHAVRGDRRGVLSRARLLRDAGYAVLLFDSQAHGESPGERITFGYLEARDARAAVRYLRQRLPGERVGYLGVSQGAAAALLGDAPLPVSSLVLESCYPTLREAIANRIEIRLGPPGRWLAPLLWIQLAPRLGVDVDRLAPIRGIARIEAPVLIIAGETDRHTKLSDSRRLFEAAQEPKELWIVPGAAHQDYLGLAEDDYRRRVLGFLARTLRSPGGTG